MCFNLLISFAKIDLKEKNKILYKDIYHINGR